MENKDMEDLLLIETIMKMQEWNLQTKTSQCGRTSSSLQQS
jgi:hypothetical protein